MKQIYIHGSIEEEGLVQVWRGKEEKGTRGRWWLV